MTNQDKYKTNIEQLDMECEYPDGLKLHPKDELHKKTVTRLLSMAENSKPITDNVKSEWRNIERYKEAYIPLDQAEAKTQQDYVWHELG